MGEILVSDSDSENIWTILQESRKSLKETVATVANIAAAREMRDVDDISPEDIETVNKVIEAMEKSLREGQRVKTISLLDRLKALIR